MYRFENINHVILQNFLFQNLKKLFLHACNLHQKYLPSLRDYKNLLFQVMFEQFFPNNPYIHKGKQFYTIIK